jgi:hypothetical protein
MFKILGEYYYVDLDMIDEYTRIESSTESKEKKSDGELDDDSSPKVHIVKYETLKFMLDIIMDIQEEIDEKMVSSTTELSIPFKLAFNTLLTKKIINKF